MGKPKGPIIATKDYSASNRIREPLGGVYYYAPPEDATWVGGGYKYWLYVWRETEAQAKRLAGDLRLAHTKYAFVVKPIPFIRGSKSFVRFGIYSRIKSGGRFTSHTANEE